MAGKRLRVNFAGTAVYTAPNRLGVNLVESPTLDFEDFFTLKLRIFSRLDDTHDVQHRVFQRTDGSFLIRYVHLGLIIIKDTFDVQHRIFGRMRDNFALALRIYQRTEDTHDVQHSIIGTIKAMASAFISKGK